MTPPNDFPQPSEVNASRIADSQRGATVTDINAFKAQRGNASVSKPYSFAVSAIAFFVFLFVVFLIAFRR